VSFVFQHEDSVEIQDCFRVFLQVDQVLISHILPTGDKELACLTVERPTAHAVDDKLEVEVLSANKRMKGALILFIVMVDQVLAILPLLLSYALFLALLIDLAAANDRGSILTLLTLAIDGDLAGGPVVSLAISASHITLLLLPFIAEFGDNRVTIV